MEEKTIDELLNEEIADEIKALSELEAGSNEKSAAIEDLTKLYKLRIEENKSSWDADDKYNRRIMDEKSNDKDDEIKQKQLEEQVKDRYFKVGIAAAELMIPLMFYGIWMNKGFKFEETGTITSSTFKGFDIVSGRYFKSDIDKLKKAENELNRQMRNEMYISLNEFYYAIGLESIKLGDSLGWNIDDGYINLRFSSQLATDGTPCLVIDYEYGPKYDFRNLM